MRFDLVLTRAQRERILDWMDNPETSAIRDEIHELLSGLPWLDQAGEFGPSGRVRCTGLKKPGTALYSIERGPR